MAHGLRVEVELADRAVVCLRAAPRFHFMEGRMMSCGVISWCKSAAACGTAKCFWLSQNSLTPTFTETFPRESCGHKSWKSQTQITKVGDTNHLDMSSCLRQSRSNGIWALPVRLKRPCLYSNYKPRPDPSVPDSSLRHDHQFATHQLYHSSLLSPSVILSLFHAS